MSRALQVFLGADLRSGHDGLADLAKKSGHDVRKLSEGEFLLFINSSKDKLKLYAAHNVVAYLRLDRGDRLDLNAISMIPRAFKASGRIEYDKVLRETLTGALARRRRSSVLENAEKAKGVYGR